MRFHKSLLALLGTAVILMSGCELEKALSERPPPPPPQPPADRDASDLIPSAEAGPGDIVFVNGERVFGRLLDAEVYSMPAKGSAQTRVTRNTSEEGEVAIAPDGTKIYFVCLGSSAICSANPDGSEVKVVVYARSINISPQLVEERDLLDLIGGISISPNGRVLAFHGTGPKTTRFNIYVYNIQTEESGPVTTRVAKHARLSGGTGDSMNPSWVLDQGLAWAKNGFIYLLPTGAAEAHAITDETMFARDPDFSPDGTKVVFEGGPRDGSYEGMWVANADGTGITQIAQKEGVSPSWSFDGSKIVFMHLQAPPDPQFDLYMMNPDGTGRTQLTNDDRDDMHPDWGDLKSTLSVSDESVPEGDAGDTTLTFDVRLRPLSDQQVTVLYSTIDDGTADPGIDYDAKTTDALVFESGETLKTIDVRVKGDTVVEPSEAFFLELKSPSGGAMIGKSRGKGLIDDDDVEPIPTPAPPLANGRIAFASTRNGGPAQIFTVDAEGSEVPMHNSTDQASSELSAPSWSRDADLRLIHTALNGAQPEIVDRPVDGSSGAFRLLVLHPSKDTDPVYVPGDPAGGFVWASDRDGDFELYYSVPNGTPKKLTDNASADQAPSVSNDGRFVVYNSDSDGDQDIYRLELSGTYDPVGTPQNLTQEATGAPKTIEVSPDYALTKDMIVFSGNEHGDFDIFKLDLTTMTETHLTTDAADESHPTMSPDGNRIAFVRDVAGNLEIFVQQAVEGQTAKNISKSPAIDDSPDWGPAATTAPASKVGTSEEDVITPSPSAVASPSPSPTPSPSPSPQPSPTSSTETFLLPATAAGFLIWIRRRRHLDSDK